MQVQNIAVGLNEILLFVFAVGPVMQGTLCLVQTVVQSQALRARGPVSTVRLAVQTRQQRHDSAQGNVPQHKFQVNCYGFQPGPSRYTTRSLTSKQQHKTFSRARNVIF